jgi:hypothetical protein
MKKQNKNKVQLPIKVKSLTGEEYFYSTKDCNYKSNEGNILFAIDGDKKQLTTFIQSSIRLNLIIEVD